MKSIRIGNDIAVTWSLYKEGQPYSLEGMAVRLYLNHALGRSEIGSFKVSGNVVAWTFEGKDQKHTGRYSLELVVNEGESGMMSVDKIDFVRLTPVTPCCEDEDEENVVTEYVELTSTVNYAPVVIQTGGSGLQYATERTVYPTWVKSDGFEPHEAEISDEYREYNKETYEMVKRVEPVFISFMGLFFFVTTIYDDSAVFNHVSHVDNHGLFSYTITITKDGDARVVSKPIQTGSSAPRDMNNDFSKDF